MNTKPIVGEGPTKEWAQCDMIRNLLPGVCDSLKVPAPFSEILGAPTYSGALTPVFGDPSRPFAGAVFAINSLAYTGPKDRTPHYIPDYGYLVCNNESDEFCHKPVGDWFAFTYELEGRPCNLWWWPLAQLGIFNQPGVTSSCRIAPFTFQRSTGGAGLTRAGLEALLIFEHQRS